MPDPGTLGLFALAALALLVIPGPAVLYVVTRSASQGRRAGLVSVLGLHTGSIVHVAAAATGLSALLLTSATAFEAVKLAGAAYLVWLGAVRLLGRSEAGERATAPPAPMKRVYGQGVVVAILNPKTALFFVAFLPQFIDPGRGPAVAQILVLGLCFILLGLLSDSMYAVLAGMLAPRLRGRRLDRGLGPRLSGAVYVALGVLAALAHRPEPA
ncbi:MAG TPA: LysE family translocator [Acidimicrobiales bacterium]|jgi:threonine/homoserine/homoserine lactone efflux protein